jgi:hypothetical protein
MVVTGSTVAGDSVAMFFAASMSLIIEKSHVSVLFCGSHGLHLLK